MAEADHLNIRITAQDLASETLRHVDHQVGLTGQSVAGLGATFGVAATAAQAALGVLGGAAGAFGNLVTSIGGLNSKLEQAGIAFETMLGSGEKAQQFLGELQTFAAQTPFEFPELVDASKKMLAFGFSAEQIMPTLRAVGNAAAAMGSGAEGIDRVTRALGQMHAKGMVQAEEIMQLTEAGIPAWDMLAKKLGVDVAGAMDAVTKRTVTADQFLQAFTEGTAARFGDMMERQSHTFAGAMSTIKDVAQMTLGGLFNPFFTQLGRFVDETAQALSSTGFQDWATSIGETVSLLAPLFGRVLESVKAAGPAIQEFIGDNIGKAVDAVQAFGDRALAVLPQVVQFLSDLGARAGEGLGRFAAVAGDIGGVLDRIGGPIATVVQKVVELNDALDSATRGPLAVFGQMVQDTIAQVSAVLGGGEADWGSFVEGVRGFIENDLGPALTNFATLAREAWLVFLSAATDAYNAVLPTLQNLQAWLGEHLPPAIEALRGTWQAFTAEIGPTLRMAWEVVGPILGQLKDWFGTVIPQAIDFLRNALAAGLEAVAAFVRPIAEWLGENLGGALHEFNLRLQEALAGMRQPLAQSAQEVGQATGQAFVAGARPATVEATALFVGIGDEAKKVPAAMEGIAPAAAQAGSGVAAGLAPATAATKEAKAATDDWKQSLDAGVLAAGLYTESWVRVVNQGIAPFNIQVQAQIKALVNAGEETEALRRVAALLGTDYDTVAQAAGGNARAQHFLADAIKRVREEMEGTRKAANAAGQAVSRYAAAGGAGGGIHFPTYDESVLNLSGRAAGTGLLEGFKAQMGEAVVPGIRQAMRDAGVAIMDEWRIRSPSQWWAENIGAPAAEGMGAGFQRAIPAVLSVFQEGLARIGSTMRDAANPIINGLPMTLTQETIGQYRYQLENRAVALRAEAAQMARLSPTQQAAINQVRSDPLAAAALASSGLGMRLVQSGALAPGGKPLARNPLLPAWALSLGAGTGEPGEAFQSLYPTAVAPTQTLAESMAYAMRIANPTVSQGFGGARIGDVTTGSDSGTGLHMFGGNLSTAPVTVASAVAQTLAQANADWQAMRAAAQRMTTALTVTATTVPQAFSAFPLSAAPGTGNLSVTTVNQASQAPLGEAAARAANALYAITQARAGGQTPADALRTVARETIGAARTTGDYDAALREAEAIVRYAAEQLAVTTESSGQLAAAQEAYAAALAAQAGIQTTAAAATARPGGNAPGATLVNAAGEFIGDRGTAGNPTSEYLNWLAQQDAKARAAAGGGTGRIGGEFAFPTFQTGGVMPYTGLARLHGGEAVFTPEQLQALRAAYITFPNDPHFYQRLPSGELVGVPGTPMTGTYGDARDSPAAVLAAAQQYRTAASLTSGGAAGGAGVVVNFGGINVTSGGTLSGPERQRIAADIVRAVLEELNRQGIPLRTMRAVA